MSVSLHEMVHAARQMELHVIAEIAEHEAEVAEHLNGIQLISA